MEDWQDADSKTRLVLCRGCDNLHEKIQNREFENDGITKRKIPKMVIHWWCGEYKLHLNFIDRVLEGCNEECPHFRN